jgi:hypothetical protein
VSAVQSRVPGVGWLGVPLRQRRMRPWASFVLYGGGVVWLSATPNGGAPSVCAGRRPVLVGCLDCIDKKQQAVEKAWFAGAGVGFHQRFDLHLWHVQNSSAMWLMLTWVLRVVALIFIGGPSTPVARAAARASGRPGGLFLPLFHMYLIQN